MAEEIRPNEIGAAASIPITKAPNAPGLPVRFDRVDWSSFAVTTLIALAGYLFTLAPNLTLDWSGVLSTSAAYAGVGPPPGYPVWTLYSWCVIELLPFSNIAWRVAVGSALASATACGLVALMVSRAGLVLFEGANIFANLKARDLVWLRLVCSAVAGLVLAFSGVVWNYAVIAETRSLSLLLFVAMLCLFFRWSLTLERKGFLIGAFLVFGLLLTNSQELIVALPGLLGAIMLIELKTGRDMTLFVLPLAVVATARNQWSIWADYGGSLNLPLFATICATGIAALMLVALTRDIGSEWKCALGCGLAMLLGLGLYFFVPLASMTTPPVNWGYPRTTEGFWHIISRGQYERLHKSAELRRYSMQCLDLIIATGRQFGWLYAAIALLLFSYARRLNSEARRLVAGLAAIWLCVTLLTLAEINPPPDRQAWEMVAQYFAASYAILAVWLGLGLMIVGAKFTAPNAVHVTATHSPESSRKHEADDPGRHGV